MKIQMLDTVETSHTIIPDLEDATIAEAPGLRILSKVRATAGGLTGDNYVLLLTRDAALDLPDRLARRLVEIGLARG